MHAAPEQVPAARSLLWFQLRVLTATTATHLTLAPPPCPPADAPAQGAEYRMDPEEYFESVGRLIHEDDLAAIAAADKDAEVALLASEFSDFDDELVGSRDFDADYAAAEGGGSDEDF